MNDIRWQQPLPQWARIASVVLGLTTAGATILMPLNAALGGALAGGAWALLGWKGIPIIASVPFGVEGQRLRIREGLQSLILRRRLVVAAVLIFPILTAGLMAVIPHRFVLTAFLLSVIPALVCLFRFVLSACPRCDHYFFVANKLRSISRCQHCNLYLKLERAISTGSDVGKKRRS
jgi:hypothetical protein